MSCWDDLDETRALDSAMSTFVGARRRMYGIARRMLGSATEADDVVQEAWIRWQAVDCASVVDPAAFLATMTTRLARNVVRSARLRRETSVGPWVPEPLFTADA